MLFSLFPSRARLRWRLGTRRDPTQIDLKDRRTSGLREAASALQGVPGIDFVTFEGADVVRHPVVMRIISAYDKHRRDQPSPERRDSRSQGNGGAAPSGA